jgi:hypothetical protein
LFLLEEFDCEDAGGGKAVKCELWTGVLVVEQHELVGKQCSPDRRDRLESHGKTLF